MKTRIKTHRFPGSVSKQETQALLEGRHPDVKRSKSLKKMLRLRERAVLKDRVRKELQHVDK